jgi:hypothetical protein
MQIGCDHVVIYCNLMVILFSRSVHIIVTKWISSPPFTPSTPSFHWISDAVYALKYHEYQRNDDKKIHGGTEWKKLERRRKQAAATRAHKFQTALYVSCKTKISCQSIKSDLSWKEMKFNLNLKRTKTFHLRFAFHGELNSRQPTCTNSILKSTFQKFSKASTLSWEFSWLP